MEVNVALPADFTGEQEASLFMLSLLPSGVLLTLLTLNLPFFLIEFACLRLFPDDVVETNIGGWIIYGEVAI